MDKIMLDALKEIADYTKTHEVNDVYNRMGWRMMEIAKKAIEKAENFRGVNHGQQNRDKKI